MWYVVQVYTSHEQAAVDLIKQCVSSASYTEVFVPQYATQVKQDGIWKNAQEVLFPGYVIVDSSHIDDVHAELMHVPAFTKLLDNSGVFIPLNNDEVSWISSFTKKDHRIIDMSQGVVEGGKVVVTSGPLIRREGLIKKINRRKRIAVIELTMFGRTIQTKVGLQLVKKS